MTDDVSADLSQFIKIRKIRKRKKIIKRKSRNASLSPRPPPIMITETNYERV